MWTPWYVFTSAAVAPCSSRGLRLLKLLLLSWFVKPDTNPHPGSPPVRLKEGPDSSSKTHRGLLSEQLGYGWKQQLIAVEGP